MSWMLRAIVLVALATPTTALAQTPDPHAGHAHGDSSAKAAPAAARDPNLPAGEDGAKAALESSPRHGELVDVAVPGDTTRLRTWIVYPERRDRAGVVILIHEIFGLSDWMRATADQVARDGFIAVVPDLVSGFGPGGGGTESAAGRDEVVKMVRGLSPAITRARLDAVHAWATALPASNGKSATIGFCWGGTRSFEYAAWQPELDAAVVYYGSSPDSSTLEQVQAPVLGLYGADDARVNTTIEPAQQRLKQRGRSFETHLFDGAGHGFLRQQSAREGANLRATRAAWPRTLAFLREHLK